MVISLKGITVNVSGTAHAKTFDASRIIIITSSRYWLNFDVFVLTKSHFDRPHSDCQVSNMTATIMTFNDSLYIAKSWLVLGDRRDSGVRDCPSSCILVVLIDLHPVDDKKEV